MDRALAFAKNFGFPYNKDNTALSQGKSPSHLRFLLVKTGKGIFPSTHF